MHLIHCGLMMLFLFCALTKYLIFISDNSLGMESRAQKKLKGVWCSFVVTLSKSCNLHAEIAAGSSLIS